MCPFPDCSRCDQGRDCEASHMATRRVFWLEPAQDEPLDPALWVWGIFAIAALVVVFWP